MKNKLDKAIKDERERFEEYADIQEWGSLDDRREILQFLETSYKRIAKVALEASKLEKKYDLYSALTGFPPVERDNQLYNLAVEDQHTKIQELLKEI